MKLKYTIIRLVQKLKKLFRSEEEKFADKWFKEGMSQSAHNNLPEGYVDEELN